MTPILGIMASAISGNLSGVSYDSIATVTVGSGGTPSISFTSIPATYKHLQIRGIISNNAANYAKINMNSDTGANYTQHALAGNGTSASAAATGASTAFIAMGRPDYLGRSGTSIFSGFIMDILDYANTNKYKTTRTLIGWDQNGGGSINFESGLWMSTSAVNSITFVPTGVNNWIEYTSLALYGIKG
tara:strand:- start:30 stop:593 length:564 start_codon:yes stop_codon:yes gene_type:complete